VERVAEAAAEEEEEDAYGYTMTTLK